MIVNTDAKEREILPNFLKPICILERFAAVFREHAEVNKTQLQLMTKLRWDSLNNYLDWMIERDLIRYEKEHKTELFRLTEKGRKLLSFLMIFIGSLK